MGTPEPALNEIQSISTLRQAKSSGPLHPLKISAQYLNYLSLQAGIKFHSSIPFCPCLLYGKNLKLIFFEFVRLLDKCKYSPSKLKFARLEIISIRVSEKARSGTTSKLNSFF
jgi:hypothetical protein